MIKKYVIADVHGCFHTLKALVEDVLSPSKEDLLYFLGDYIDRGAKSKDVIDYIRDLKQNGYNVVALMGNHEESMIQAILEDRQKKSKFSLFKKSYPIKDRWFEYGGKETLTSFGVENPSDISDDYFEWLSSLKNYFIEERFLLAHAGFNFKIDNIFDDQDSMRWIRDFEVDFDKSKGKRVIHGHVPVRLELIKKLIQEEHFGYIDLDNGCIYKSKPDMGNLVSLELNSLELFVQKNIEPIE